MYDPQPPKLSSLKKATAARRKQPNRRRWATEKRKQLEACYDQIHAAVQEKIPRHEILDLLRKDGIKVGRWLLSDVLANPPARPAKPALPDHDATSPQN